MHLCASCAVGRELCDLEALEAVGRQQVLERRLVVLGETPPQARLVHTTTLLSFSLSGGRRTMYAPVRVVCGWA
jgi:hypothetical protein